MSRRVGPIGLAGALVVAAWVRVALLLHHRDAPGWATPPPGLDAALYHELGVRVAGGDLALGDAAYHYAPLPAYVQGAVYALLGPDPTWLPWLHLVAGLVVVGLVYAMASRMAGPLAGVVAASLAALYAPLIVYDTRLLPTTQATVLLLAACAALLRATQARVVWWAVLAGGLLGLACLARGNALALAPLGALLLLWLPRSLPARRRVLAAGLFGVCLVAAISPVTLRNRVVSGEWVLISTTAGVHFFVGNHAGADGGSAAVEGLRPSPAGYREDARRLAERAEGRELTDSEVSSHFTARALRFWTDSPRRGTLLLARKALLLFSRYELPNNLYLPFFDRDWPLLRWLPGYGVVAPLGFLGVGLGFFLPRLRVAALLACAYGATLGLTFVVARYRLPFAALLLPLAGASVALGVEALRERRLGPLLASGAAASFFTFLVWSGDFREAERRHMELAEKQHVMRVEKQRLESLLHSAAADEGARIDAALRLAQLHARWDDPETAERLLEDTLSDLPGAAPLRTELERLRLRPSGP